MTLSSLWMSAQTIVADSTHKEKIAEKLTALSHMSGEEVMSTIIRGALDISARILIALVILAIGRWIIRYLKNILRKMLTKREVDASLKKFPDEPGEHLADAVSDYHDHQHPRYRHHVVRRDLRIGRSGDRHGVERYVAELRRRRDDPYIQAVPCRRLHRSRRDRPARSKRSNCSTRSSTRRTTKRS